MSNQNSRSGYRSKRKKTNLVLNSLIVIVLLLIIVVAYNIFASGNDSASPKTESPKTEQTQTKSNDSSEKESVQKEQEKEQKDEAVTEDNSSDANVSEDNQDSEEATAPETPEDTQTAGTDDGSSSAEQTGEHKMTFEGEDWQAMLNAISSATGLDQSNMTVYWLGSDKSTTNAAVGTVASKDKSQQFKVYIKWVDGQGYVPTKVEKLSDSQ